VNGSPSQAWANSALFGLQFDVAIKSSIGISLKKYLIWSKLKSTIKNHLENNDDLFSALIKSGFYDQPHFSKNFKCMLGVKPSKVYKSRIIQVLSDLTQ
jgi:methylphosphotriester-DNA--protein-cysteine methyltransferase